MNRNITLLRDELNHNMTLVVLPVTLFIGIEAFVGLFGNILILLIYLKRYKQSNFRSFVLSLAIVDLTSCCTTLPGEMFSQLNWYNYEYDWICKVKSYFNVFTAWSSASILLILAFDRYRKICRPLSWQIHTTLAWQMCGFSFILSAFVSIPVTILWGKQSYVYEIDEFNLTVSVCEKSDEYADGIYPLAYIGSVYMLPVSLMIFVAGSLNFLTARPLFRHGITLKTQSRRLSVTSLSFATDSFNMTESMSSENKQHLEANEENTLKPVTSKLSTPMARKSMIASNSCTNIHLTSFARFDNHTVISIQPPLSGSEPTNKPANKIAGSIPSARAKIANEVSTITGNNNLICQENYGKGNDAKMNLRVEDIGSDVIGYTKRGYEERVDNQRVDEGSVDNRDDSEQNGKYNSTITNCEKSNNNCSSDTCKVRNGGLHQTTKLPRPKPRKSKFHHWQKTIIMLILTTVFVFTMSTYVILTSLVAKPDGILKGMSNSHKVVFFFFWRLYFINSVVNPILYGFMDPRFRAGFMSFVPGYRSKRGTNISRGATSVIK